MTDGVWFSAMIGAGIAVIYNVAAIVLGRVAMKSPQQTFNVIVMGGMVARLFVTVIIITLIILFTSINQLAFLAGFFILFVVGLAVEVVTLHQKRKQKENNQESSDDSETL